MNRAPPRNYLCVDTRGKTSGGDANNGERGRKQRLQEVVDTGGGWGGARTLWASEEEKPKFGVLAREQEEEPGTIGGVGGARVRLRPIRKQEILCVWGGG